MSVEIRLNFCSDYLGPLEGSVKQAKEVTFEEVRLAFQEGLHTVMSSRNITSSFLLGVFFAGSVLNNNNRV